MVADRIFVVAKILCHQFLEAIKVAASDVACVVHRTLASKVIVPLQFLRPNAIGTALGSDRLHSCPVPLGSTAVVAPEHCVLTIFSPGRGIAHPFIVERVSNMV